MSTCTEFGPDRLRFAGLMPERLIFRPKKSIQYRLSAYNHDFVNPLDLRGNYSATLNNMKLVHWPLVGGLLHLVQRGGDWAGLQPAQAHFRCTNL